MEGRSWLSLLIWGTPLMTQKLLMTHLYPYLTSKEKKGTVEAWFFVRYWEELPHVRLRVLTERGNHKSILSDVHFLLDPYVEAGQLWKLEETNYHPELSRYFKENMDNVEFLFFMQSRWAISLFQRNLNEETRLYAVSESARCAVQNAYPEIELQHQFVKEQRNYFKGRLEFQPTTNKVISQKYRVFSTISANLKNEFLSNSKNIAQILKLTSAIAESEHPKVLKKQRIRDMVHMTVNKCFLTDHDQWEFLLYEFLDRRYLSNFAKNR
ncbi:MAG: thiopeptide-type bacteriocin biosynthesis protein [Bacteroidota bacterium]